MGRHGSRSRKASLNPIQSHMKIMAKTKAKRSTYFYAVNAQARGNRDTALWGTESIPNIYQVGVQMFIAANNSRKDSEGC